MLYNSKIVSFIGIVSLFLSCNGNTHDENQPTNPTLTIAVAANAQFVMKAIEKAYEKNTGIEVQIVIGSSGKLTAQISQGAPYDLLVAADMKYPNNLYEGGHATTTPRVYASGSLVLWTMNEAILLDTTLQFLLHDTIHKLVIANPKNAPYGEQAIKAMEHLGIFEKLQSKLVFGESIAQTNQYILTGNCEVGITAKSVVLAPEMAQKGFWIEIPLSSYELIKQGVIITKYGQSNNQEATKHFYNFLFSEEGAAIFESYGYLL